MSALLGTSTAYPAVKFKNVNDGVAGTIIGHEDYQQTEYEDDAKKGVKKGDPMTYPSGDPVMGTKIHLETIPGDATSRVTLYCQGKLLMKAVASAIRAAGAQDVEDGADLAVKFTGYDGRAKTYSAAYSRPEPEAPSDAPDDSEPPF